ncbi:MAG: AraC family transcriptional regulator, partial [Nitrospinota bacterium]
YSYLANRSHSLKLLNEIRKDMAVNYLKDKNVSIGEVAYILGFSETSAFYRAFKKWTSFTPSEFRTGDVSK